MTKTSSTEFIQFLIVGGVAAGFNFISRIGFNEFFSYRLSIILAYLVGMIIAFTLFKHYVFAKSNRHYIDEVKGFVIVNIFGIIQVWLISVGLAEYFFPSIHFNFHPEEVAHFIALGIPAISSYFGHKYFSFSNRS